MTLKDFMTVIDYKITEGSVYQWSCFGDNAHSLDGEQEGHTVTVVFDTLTQVVYQAMAYDYNTNCAYRWTNPMFVAAYQSESFSRSCNDEAWDDVAYTELEVDKDFLEKARAIVTGTPYDTRVMVSLDLDNDTLLKLMTGAHNADVTLNQYIEEILREIITNGE